MSRLKRAFFGHHCIFYQISPQLLQLVNHTVTSIQRNSKYPTTPVPTTKAVVVSAVSAAGRWNSYSLISWWLLLLLQKKKIMLCVYVALNTPEPALCTANVFTAIEELVSWRTSLGEAVATLCLGRKWQI